MLVSKEKLMYYSSNFLGEITLFGFDQLQKLSFRNDLALKKPSVGVDEIIILQILIVKLDLLWDLI